MDYRISFSPNGIEPFTWKAVSFESASKLAVELTQFDLGRYDNLTKNGERMIAAYKAYRREHSINHPDCIQFSSCTIDQQDSNMYWWIVSENLEEKEFEMGDMPAHDTDSENPVVWELYN